MSQTDDDDNLDDTDDPLDESVLDPDAPLPLAGKPSPNSAFDLEDDEFANFDDEDFDDDFDDDFEEEDDELADDDAAGDSNTDANLDRFGDDEDGDPVIDDED